MPAISLAETAFLMSLFKPIVFLLAMGGWAAAVSNIDKDLAYYYLPRRPWNLILIAAGIVAFGLWLLMPTFWLGLPLALLIIVGSLYAYMQFRNSKVKESERWTFNPKSWFSEKLAASRHAAAQESAKIAFTTKAGVRLDVPGPNDPQAPAHEAVERVLGFALPRGGQRIDMGISAEKVVVVATVDGVKYPISGLDVKSAINMLDYLKTHAQLDVEDRRRKQVGEVYVEAGDERQAHLLKISTIGSTKEMQLTIMIDPNKAVAMRLEDLGLLGPQFEALKPVIGTQKRAVLVACPSGNGMTTTLYALINRHDPYTQSVMTLEPDVLYEVEGVTHNTIDTGQDAPPVAEQLAAITRMDPAVMLFEPIKDVASAKVIAGVANELRTYAGMQQEDTFKTLKAWLKAIGDPGKGANALAAVVSPRLVRKLCETCRVPFKPDPAALQKMNLPPDKVQQLYKHSGKVQVKNEMQDCPDCYGMGYRGRTGVFEVLVLDDEARKLLAAGQLDQVRAHLRKQRMLWLQEAALNKVVQGVTSITEVQRALGG